MLCGLLSIRFSRGFHGFYGFAVSILLSFTAGQAIAAETKASWSSDSVLTVKAVAVLDRVGAVVRTFDLDEKVKVREEKNRYYVIVEEIQKPGPPAPTEVLTENRSAEMRGFFISYA